jgi:hypothetical protein
MESKLYSSTTGGGSEAPTDPLDGIALGHLEDLNEGDLLFVDRPDREGVSQDRRDEQLKDFSPVGKADGLFKMPRA